MSQWDAVDMALPLKSWTRNVPVAEGLEVLDLAEPGMPLADWRDAADARLPHTDPAYRQTLLRLVRRMFVDVEDGTLVASPFLRLLRSGDQALRHDLFFARYALAHPWCLLAARHLILPRIARMGAAGSITTEEWDAFVVRYIEPKASDASRKKTRSTVTGLFQHLRVLHRDGPSTAPTTLHRSEPAPLAFAWMVADQMASQLMGEASRAWAVAHSDAAQLFAVSPDYAERCIDTAIETGELRVVERAGEAFVAPGSDYCFAPLPVVTESSVDTFGDWAEPAA